MKIEIDQMSMILWTHAKKHSVEFYVYA